MENKEIMVQGIANERAIFKRLKERGGCDNVLSSRFFLKDVEQAERYLALEYCPGK